MDDKQCIAEVSDAVMQLDQSRTVRLGSGRRLEVSRLNWLQFEAVWPELAGVLGALACTGEDAGSQELIDRLLGAPACLLKLVVLGTELTEEEASRLDFDDVLLIAAALVELNFVETAGVRSFFTALGRLAPPVDSPR